MYKKEKTRVKQKTKNALQQRTLQGIEESLHNLTAECYRAFWPAGFRAYS